jgi:hypothetical protein
MTSNQNLKRDRAKQNSVQTIPSPLRKNPKDFNDYDANEDVFLDSNLTDLSNILDDSVSITESLVEENTQLKVFSFYEIIVL